MCFWIFKTTADLASPSDIFKSMEFMWTDGAIYETDCTWKPDRHYTKPKIFRVKKEYVNIPFTEDPILYPSPIPGTSSMDPVFDKEHHNLYMAGGNTDEHKILLNWLEKEWQEPDRKANIVVYEPEDRSKYLVHRLHGIDSDDIGRLWWFKGDNNANKDKLPARDSGIYWVLSNTTY